jgi:hypothetical protein
VCMLNVKYEVTLDATDPDDEDFSLFCSRNDIHLTKSTPAHNYIECTFASNSYTALVALIIEWFRTGDDVTDREMLRSIKETL